LSAIVCKALRRRNFATMLVDKNIKRNVLDIYEVRFEPMETKARRRILAALSRKLTPFFDRWFSVIRPVLLDGRDSDAMWISIAGTDMSHWTFYKRFCKATLEELNVRINPHMTRKIVATGVAIASPELVGMVGSLLDQSSDQSAAHDLADQLSASRSYLGLLETRRRQALKSLPNRSEYRRRH
jgi:integrase/recombinase XerD